MNLRTALVRVGLAGGVTIGRLVGTIVMFALVARAVGPAPFAALTYWYAISVMAAAVTEYGFAQHLLSSLPGESTERRRALICEAVGAKLWLTSIAAAVTIACAWLTAASAQEAAMASVLVVGAMIGSIGELHSMILRAEGAFSVESRTSLLTGLVASLLAGAVGMSGAGLLAIALTLAGVRAAGLLLQRRAIASLTGATMPLWPTGANAAAAIGGLRAGASNGIDNVAIQLLLNFDVLACRALLDPIQAGLYLSANRLTNAANAGFPVLTSVFLPAIAAQPDAPAGRRAARLLVIAALVVALGWNLAMWTGHAALAELMFGQQFAAAGAFLGPLALAVGARYLSLEASVRLIVLRRQVAKAVATLLAIAAGGVWLIVAATSRSHAFDAHDLVQCVIAVYTLQSASHWALARWYGRSAAQVPARAGAASLGH